MIKYICKQCGKKFKEYACRKPRIFCSKECRNTSMKGIPFFDSTGIPSWNKGLKGVTTAWNKGKTGIFSKETIEKMRQTALNKSPQEHSCWKGGRRNFRGYIAIYSPDHPYRDKNNCVREHRLVMEKHLGRYLTPKEVVHHLNGNKSDNRIENLKLFGSNSKHIIFHCPTGRPPKIKQNPS